MTKSDTPGSGDRAKGPRLALAALAVATLIFPLAASAGHAPAAGPPYQDGVVLVAYASGTSTAEAAKIEAAAGASKQKLVGKSTRLLKVPRGQVEAEIAKLKRNRAVLYAEPNYIVRVGALPGDPAFSDLWGLRNTAQSLGCGADCYGSPSGASDADIGASAAWDVSTGSRANVVGVVDTGVDYTHPDLAGNIWSAPSSFTVAVGGRTVTCAAGTHGFNAITSSCDPFDDNGHGTHVSGTIGAVGNNGVGVAGVNWTASIMGLKFFDAAGNGTIADAINAIEFAIQAKAAVGANVRVLSNSWTGGGFSKALQGEINRTYASNMLFVAAAGNEATNNDSTPSYPSSYTAPNVIAVAATDDNDLLAPFSNYGASSVDLGAPGVDVLSTTPNNTYAWFSGTSMATPHVAGAAALVLSTCAFDTAALKNDLLTTVDPLSSLSGLTATGGRLDANKAIRACSAPAPAAPPIPAGLTAAAGNAQVALSWSASAGATGYNVKRATSASGPFATIGQVGAPGYVDTSVSNGSTYYYAVSALGPGGESADSGMVGATPRAKGGGGGGGGDYSLTATPTTAYAHRGQSVSYVVHVVSSGTFTNTVTFSVGGLPAGVQTSFSPATVTGSGSTTLTVTPGIARGTFSFTINATSGATTRAVQAALVSTK